MYIPGTDIPEDHAAALLRERRYEPGPAAGPVVILASQQFYELDGEPDLGWGALLRPGWESHEVPGDHNSMIAEPYVHTLAARLAECLERASIDEGRRNRRGLVSAGRGGARREDAPRAERWRTATATPEAACTSTTPRTAGVRPDIMVARRQ